MSCNESQAEQAFKIISPPTLTYRILNKEEEINQYSHIRDVISNYNLRRVGANDPTVWENGWEDVYRFIMTKDINFNELKPQYFHEKAPCRLFGNFVEQISDNFEYWVGLLVRCVYFNKHLSSLEGIYEFGCGTGINILILNKINENLHLTGCDWAKASKDILLKMPVKGKGTINGYRFNMLTLQGEIDFIKKNCGLLTVHALEQLGRNWNEFLQFIIRNNPQICVHIEPLFELYQNADVYSNLAADYHVKRGYLNGFVDEIKSLESKGMATIIELHRIEYSGLYHEAYSILVWKLL